MKRGEILYRAAEIVTGKDTEHGEVEDSFGKIAQMWAAYLGAPVAPKDVAVLMILLKTVRISSGHQVDNWVDISGYAACGGELEAAAAAAAGTADVDTGYQD